MNDLRLLGQLAKGFCEDKIRPSVACWYLKAAGGEAMAAPAHQFGGAGPGSGRQGDPSVSKIVKVQIGPSNSTRVVWEIVSVWLLGPEPSENPDLRQVLSGVHNRAGANP